MQEAQVVEMNVTSCQGRLSNSLYIDALRVGLITRFALMKLRDSPDYYVNDTLG